MSGTKGGGPDEGGFALWGGRFEAGGLAPEADALNRSLPVDGRLWREEVEVAGAWAEALGEMGVLAPGETQRLLEGLKRVEARLSEGAAATAHDEDIHTLVERLLTDEIGEAAGRCGCRRSAHGWPITRLTQSE